MNGERDYMDKLDIVTDESGNKVVLLPEIIFSNKQNINWDDVEAVSYTHLTLPTTSRV